MIGSISDVINAKRVFLRLDPSGVNQQFVVLQEITLPLSRPETREAVEGGAVYFYGQHDNAFDCTFLLTGDDISFYLDYNKLVNNALVEQTYAIDLISKQNVTKTITVTAVTPDQSIEKLLEGGVKISQTFRITEDVDGSNVT